MSNSEKHTPFRTTLHHQDNPFTMPLEAHAAGFARNLRAWRRAQVADNGAGVFGMRDARDYYFYDVFTWALFDPLRPVTFTAMLKRSPDDSSPLRATFTPTPAPWPAGQRLLVIPPGGDAHGRQALVDALVLEGREPMTAEELRQHGCGPISLQRAS